MATATMNPAPTATKSRTCRLTLAICGVEYRVRPLVNEAFGGRSAWRLRKLSTGTVYDVADTLHGPTCDCADFTFARDGIDPLGCKHIRALRSLGLIG